MSEDDDGDVGWIHHCEAKRGDSVWVPGVESRCTFCGSVLDNCETLARRYRQVQEVALILSETDQERVDRLLKGSGGD